MRGRGQSRPERIRIWPIKDNEDTMFGRTDRDSAEVIIVQTYSFNRVLVQRADFVPPKKK